MRHKTGAYARLQLRLVFSSLMCVGFCVRRLRAASSRARSTQSVGVRQRASDELVGVVRTRSESGERSRRSGCSPSAVSRTIGSAGLRERTLAVGGWVQSICRGVEEGLAKVCQHERRTEDEVRAQIVISLRVADGHG